MSPRAPFRDAARALAEVRDRWRPDTAWKVSSNGSMAVAARHFASAVPGVVTVGIGLLALLAAAYAATILFGMARGDALPTATFSFLVDPTGWVQHLYRGLPYALVLIAAAGAAASWLLTIHPSDSRPGSTRADIAGYSRKLRRCEFQLLRGWKWLGWLVVPAILIFGFSSGGWSGVARARDIHYMSLIGLVPYSDAAGYLFASLTQALHGEWI